VLDSMVDAVGIEPTTCRLRAECLHQFTTSLELRTRTYNPSVNSRMLSFPPFT
jgi:hypothetical protein